MAVICCNETNIYMFKVWLFNLFSSYFCEKRRELWIKYFYLEYYGGLLKKEKEKDLKMDETTVAFYRCNFHCSGTGELKVEDKIL